MKFVHWLISVLWPLKTGKRLLLCYLLGWDKPCDTAAVLCRTWLYPTVYSHQVSLTVLETSIFELIFNLLCGMTNLPLFSAFLWRVSGPPKAFGKLRAPCFVTSCSPSLLHPPKVIFPHREFSNPLAEAAASSLSHWIQSVVARVR